MEVRALHKWVHISPSKVGRYCDAVRHLPVDAATRSLELDPSPSSFELLRAIRSAVANAENNHGLDPEDLVVKEAAATDAIRMKRLLPRARGRAETILKRSCHILVVVTDDEAERAKVKPTRASVAAAAKPTGKGKAAKKPAGRAAAKKAPARPAGKKAPAKSAAKPAAAKKAPAAKATGRTRGDRSGKGE
jgi:large subunit ribosomal protein L22